jgi:CHAT domain-containing protein
VDRLKEALPPAAAKGRPRYLHLATHGFFDRTSREGQRLRPFAREEALPFGLAREYQTYTRNPLLLCGLVLAGANADPDRGILRAEEVAGLDLRGCEMAVLSACETGLGKVADTEGVQGLQRAFQVAGARSLVVSLWKVHDAATSVLMEEFYTNLWHKKLSRIEALRKAQLTVLRNPALVQKRQQELAKLGVRGPEDEPAPLPPGGTPAAARSHPALWAAFILSGDTGPIGEGKQ